MPASKSIYFNLPSTSLSASESFITALGLTKKADWSMETSRCFSLTDSIYVFYHNHDTYKKWLPKEQQIADTNTMNSCIVTLETESKDQVDELVAKVISVGGKQGPNMLEAMDMEGVSGTGEECKGMYSRSVLDPDGHLFEVVSGMK